MDDEPHISTDRARAGETPHIARYVLHISGILAVLALGAVVLWYANYGERPSEAENIAAQSQPDSVPKSPEYLQNRTAP